MQSLIHLDLISSLIHFKNGKGDFFVEGGGGGEGLQLKGMLGLIIFCSADYILLDLVLDKKFVSLLTQLRAFTTRDILNALHALC